MTPKDKAKELVDKFVIYTDVKDNLGRIDHDLWIERNKKCALICQDEKIETLQDICKLKKGMSTEEIKYLSELLEIKRKINNL